MHRRTHYYGSYTENEIGFAVAPLPFVPLGYHPPCTGHAETFTLAGDDKSQSSINRNGRARLESAEREAKAICGTCPLKRACRAYALDTRQGWGVWGATTSTQRETWAKSRPAKAPVSEDDMNSFDDTGAEPLFDDTPLRVKKTKPRTRNTSIAAKGNCPACLRNPASIVRIGEHWSWKEHTYRTWGGAVATCQASGVALCIAPEPNGKQYGATPVRCPHDTRDETRP